MLFQLHMIAFMRRSRISAITASLHLKPSFGHHTVACLYLQAAAAFSLQAVPNNHVDMLDIDNAHTVMMRLSVHGLSHQQRGRLCKFESSPQDSDYNLSIGVHS